MAKAQPKLDWLDAARRALNDDPAFRKLGSVDVTLGLAIGDEARLVPFEAFEVGAIAGEGDEQVDFRDADLVLEMTPKDWNAYLRQRARGQGPSLLTLDLADKVFRAADPLAALKLTRYSRSLQAFIDAGARLAA